MIETTSLKTSKRLLQLGVEKKSFLVWLGSTKDNTPELRLRSDLLFGNSIPAYTTEELGRMLPKTIRGCELRIGWDRVAEDWNCWYEDPVTRGDALSVLNTYDIVMAEAVGLMLIQLLENGRSTIEEVNAVREIV